MSWERCTRSIGTEDTVFPVSCWTCATRFAAQAARTCTVPNRKPQGKVQVQAGPATGRVVLVVADNLRRRPSYAATEVPPLTLPFDELPHIIYQYHVEVRPH